MTSSRAPFLASRPQHSSRIKDAFDELNKYAASPKHGATFEQIKAVHRARRAQPPPKDAIPEDDLVNRLINDPDTKDLWQSLVNIQFPKEIGATGPNDATAPALLKGFEAYMVQDYIYCARGIFYQTERTFKAVTAEEFDETAVKVSNYAEYAQGALHLCIDPVDKGLGLKDGDVLQAKPADALDTYTGFQFKTAKDHDWVMGLVAMIPCIQSYYAIGKPLYDAASDSVKETLWYKLWIKPSGSVSPDDAGVTGQISFFVANYNVWKDRYNEAKEIFKQACEGEIGLWKHAEENKA